MAVESGTRVRDRRRRKDPERIQKTPVAVQRNGYARVKAAGDFALALILLTLTAPIVLLAALVIKLTSKGPAFYFQVRLGREGRPFRIIKLRTMTHNCESLTGARWATACDPRVTAVGRFLRKTHVDELPQLWNVIRGEMSVVGPRPERPEFAPTLERAILYYRERLAVRPGVTGLAQVQLPPDTDLRSVRRKLAYDLYYVEHVGFWLDLRILASTLCYIAGVPTDAFRRFCRLPNPLHVERSYEMRESEADFSAQFQPA